MVKSLSYFRSPIATLAKAEILAKKMRDEDPMRLPLGFGNHILDEAYNRQGYDQHGNDDWLMILGPWTSKARDLLELSGMTNKKC